MEQVEQPCSTDYKANYAVIMLLLALLPLIKSTFQRRSLLTSKAWMRKLACFYRATYITCNRGICYSNSVQTVRPSVFPLVTHVSSNVFTNW